MVNKFETVTINSLCLITSTKKSRSILLHISCFIVTEGFNIPANFYNKKGEKRDRVYPEHVDILITAQYRVYGNVQTKDELSAQIRR